MKNNSRGLGKEVETKHWRVWLGDH